MMRHKITKLDLNYLLKKLEQTSKNSLKVFEYSNLQPNVPSLPGCWTINYTGT